MSDKITFDRVTSKKVPGDVREYERARSESQSDPPLIHTPLPFTSHVSVVHRLVPCRCRDGSVLPRSIRLHEEAAPLRGPLRECSIWSRELHVQIPR